MVETGWQNGFKRPSAMMRTQRLNSKIQEFLSQYVKGKTVLDVGCVAHSAYVEREDLWLHKHLASSAKSILGLDILESDAAELRQRGYEVTCGDAMTVSLNRTFDVVVAGEIVEHIDDPAAFVSNMARHLNEQGRLVMTTPHVFFFLHFLESIFSSAEQRWNPQHVAWYCPFTLGNLLHRNNLEVESCYYFTRSRKLRRLLKFTHLPCYGIVASSILVIARKRP
jgi:2-polyprenyl-3-methyl-5-hydroxy-6-metoxy-1,4-benzoquinol methylase